MKAHLSALLVLFAATAFAGDAPPAPILGTMSHSVMKGVVHAFSEKDLRTKAGAPIIIANVSMPMDTHQAKLLHIEYFPIFVHPGRAEKGISKEQLKDVLEGKIKDWRDLGQKEGRIQLLLHGSPLQRKAFEALIKTKLNVDPAKLQTAEPRRFNTYDELRRTAEKEPNSMTIGLNTWKPGDLRMLPLDGVSLADPKAKDKYLLRAPIYLYTHRDGAKEVKNSEVLDMFNRKLTENIRKMESPYK